KDYTDGTLEHESIFSVFPPELMGQYDANGWVGETDLWHHAQLTNDEPPKPKLANFLLMYRNGIEPTGNTYFLEVAENTFEEQLVWGQYSMAQGNIVTADSNAVIYDREKTFGGIIPQNDITQIFWLDWLVQLYKKTAYRLNVTFPVRFGVYLKVTSISIIYLNGFYHFLASWQYETATGMLTLDLLRFGKIDAPFVETTKNGIMRFLGKDF
ncbi:unnamed protein product, partial [marine sediment metagenome]